VCPVDKLVPVPGRSGRYGRRHFLHQSLDGMGIDEISSQPQGGRLAPADGGCIQRGKVCAQLAQQYRFKTINVIRRREQDQETPGRVGLLVEGLRIERHFACVFAELLSTMLEVIHVEDNRNAVSLKELILYKVLLSNR
jgi:hypothetical protein